MVANHWSNDAMVTIHRSSLVDNYFSHTQCVNDVNDDVDDDDFIDDDFFYDAGDY